MKRNIFVYTIALACSLLIAACSQDENITLSNNDKNKMNKKILNNSKRRYTRAYSANTNVNVHWLSGFV